MVNCLDDYRCECFMCMAYLDSLIQEFFEYKRSGLISGGYNPETPAKRACKEIITGELSEDEVEFRIYVIKNQPDGAKYLDFLKTLGYESMD